MGKEYKRSHDRIVGKIVVNCTIENTSPLLMSSGREDHSARDVIRWVDGNPYLPASSLIGVIKSWYDRFFPEESNEYFWGSDDTSKCTTYQSHFVIDDCRLKKGSTKDRFLVRDGVRIDSQYGVAEDKGKYDYEILAPSHQFDFRMEVTARKSGLAKGCSLDELKKYTCRILSILHHELFALGALTTTGFGKVKVTEMKMAQFDFTNGRGESWFSFLETPVWDLDLSVTDLPKIQHTYCKIDVHFHIKSALITGAYPIDEASSDKVQLQTNGQNVLSGKAIKGSLRHRAAKILQAAGHQDVDGAISNIFGFVSKKDKSAIVSKEDTPTIKSRLIIHESIIDRGVQSMVQDRIKIDRWTGGVMGGAKFDSRPIWNVSDEEEDGFVISMVLDKAQQNEIALLLHLVRDLWTSDLPIGGEKNIGRGILKGHRCIILLPDGNEVRIENENDGLKIKGKESLTVLNQQNLSTLKTKSHEQN